MVWGIALLCIHQQGFKVFLSTSSCLPRMQLNSSTLLHLWIFFHTRTLHTWALSQTTILLSPHFYVPHTLTQSPFTCMPKSTKPFQKVTSLYSWRLLHYVSLWYAATPFISEVFDNIIHHFLIPYICQFPSVNKMFVLLLSLLFLLCPSHHTLDLFWFFLVFFWVFFVFGY